jgi:predicted acyltransferase
MVIQEENKLPGGRITSLDQFRGFAIFGMILVNYLGHFESVPVTFKHPNYGMTFANTIAPFFLFAVGMGFRMSLINQIRKSGRSKSYLIAAKRYLTLILIGIVLYGPDPKLGMWDALVDIGFAGLITLPFILSQRGVRITVAIAFLILYQGIFTFSGYGEWTMIHSIDGGPLGVLSWASILIFGTLLMDDFSNLEHTVFIRRSLVYAIILMAIGYGLTRVEPSSLWQFSQRSMTMAYPLFASGLSYAVFVLFFWLADLKKIEIPHLTVLGMNPLILYLVQNVLIELRGDLLDRNAPLWQALSGAMVIYLICFIVARYMVRNKVIVKI